MYCVQVYNNPVKASRMYEQADDVEDMLSKDSLDAAVNFTLLSPVRLFS